MCVTFPLVLDVVAYVQVDGDVGADAGGPVLPDVGLGHLHDGEGGDGLSHPGPAPEHHAPVLRTPVSEGRGKGVRLGETEPGQGRTTHTDRKSTRLNSSH